MVVIRNLSLLELDDTLYNTLYPEQKPLKQERKYVKIRSVYDVVAETSAAPPGAIFLKFIKAPILFQKCKQKNAGTKT